MGVFARKLGQEIRRFAVKLPGEAAQAFGRKITGAVQHHGQQVADLAHGAADKLKGFDGVSSALHNIGSGADSAVSVARLLDQNQPRAAADTFLQAIGKYY